MKLRLLSLLLLSLFACDEETSLSAADDQGETLPPGRDAAFNDNTPDAGEERGDTGLEPRLFGEPCQSPGDCLMGYCVPDPQGLRVCTQTCYDDESCPEQWECRPVNNTYPDTVFICVAERHVQCLPCEHDGHCGSGEDRCVSIGNGLYCARNCVTEACPEGHSCTEMEIDGEALSLCRPEGESCRPCRDQDGDGYGEGEDCAGFDCDDEDPLIYEGAPEVCDSKDNNCNALTDDAVAIPESVSCGQVGVCQGSIPRCVQGAWSCDYGSLYSEDDQRCDELDNDCDGSVDEDVDFEGDLENCGFCGEVCAFDNGFPDCEEGVCILGSCEEEYYDLDEEPENGCEYHCNLSNEGEEQCDGIDNDCDGEIDEETNLLGDSLNCGGCGQICAFDFAQAHCEEGRCLLAECEPEHWDLDRDPENGCEYICLFDAEEDLCDGVDNDCDGELEEDADLHGDPMNCGSCGHACDFEFASASCIEGVCVLLECDPGHWDLDAQAENGCEYICAFSPEDPEQCDGIDNNCDGQVDEEFNLDSDLLHCGACNQLCAPAFALPLCEQGRCLFESCQAGHYDLNGIQEDGCEYDCLPTESAEERCNLRDDDCDGLIDEGFDLSSDVSHCGVCEQICVYPNARPLCLEGACQMGACDQFFWDIDGLSENGCEYACVITQGGQEVCDEIDNDCDGLIDEGFDLNSDVEHCGLCDQGCAFQRGIPRCLGGECLLEACAEGYWDLDEDSDNGCEYACLLDGEEICDEIDNDCDGLIDEGFDLNIDLEHCGACEQPCEPLRAEGRCIEGQCTIDRCDSGSWDLDGEVESGCEYRCGESGEEICDQQDNDCDGLIDEGFDLEGDPRHCGVCNQRCVAEHAEPLCLQGDCQPGECEPNWHDLDGAPGCEYPCAPTLDGEEACDEIDNDCDGVVDEGYDLERDVDHCGACGQACRYPFGVGECQAGSCVLIACHHGYVDQNEDPNDGCEYGCVPTGSESCDEIDNNCNGEIDETFQFLTDLQNCGRCNNVCSFEHALPACEFGHCRLMECDLGHINLNGLSQDGCEYACLVDGAERCDLQDNDCDGAVDEDFDLQTDTMNCGRCGEICFFDNATPECFGGECRIESCQAGFWNLDGDSENGCEYPCFVTENGVEVCDEADNDCNGFVDEGFDLSRDPEHCGDCNAACDLPHAVSGCRAGSCVITECAPGRVDLNLEPEDGCEYACTPSNDGEERCDEQDNNCDGEIDEGFDLSSDPLNCGLCGIDCRRPNALVECALGSCQFLGCEEHYWDLDGNAANGCEYACQRQGAEDLPDLMGLDSNCDGIDGDIQHALFVSPAGDDEGPGSMERPLRSLGVAITQAYADDEIQQVLVSRGVYREALQLKNAVHLFGGYDHSQRWLRDLELYESRIESDSIPVQAFLVGEETYFQGFTIEDIHLGAEGRSSYAVHISFGDGLILEACRIIAGPGGFGADGISGSNGANGARGGDGQSGYNDGSSGGYGGAGASSSCGATGGRGGRGGYGNNRGSGGGSGGGIMGAPGGPGGAPGTDNCWSGCSHSDPGCGPGQSGSGCTGNLLSGGSGGSGQQGAGGTGEGQLDGLYWVGYVGQDGVDGVHGSGGGGGGGGAGNDCCLDDRGGGGGGGGAGGCAGTRGRGGHAGGGSFGVFIYHANPEVRDNLIITAGGGSGGDGGDGGLGGNGGLGGAGGPRRDDGNRGGSGSSGGRGGRGGCGGGGAGGVSYGIYRVQDAEPILSGNSFEIGPGGQGGSSCRHPGEEGDSGELL